MADETRVTNDRMAGHVHRDQVAEHADVEATIRPTATSPVAVPDDPEAARAEIEVTRARMSETIDEIEDALLRKKERIQNRLDVTSPVRERPLPAVGIALGAGILLGFLTGGDDDEDEGDHDYHLRSGGIAVAGAAAGAARLRDLESRADTWEDRARRLLTIAREQEAEIERLSRQSGSAGSGSGSGSDGGWSDEQGEDDGSSMLDRARDRILAGLAGYISTAVKDMVSSNLSGRTR